MKNLSWKMVGHFHRALGQFLTVFGQGDGRKT
jgi:hypothetical protein